MTSIASFHQTPLLEIRTETGAVYLCPSRLQRVRLQWTFRHFHVLPPQVLSRQDQRLIEKLTRSAVVTPKLPVSSDAILGVLEKAGARSTGYEPEADFLAMDSTAGGLQTPDQRWSVLGAIAGAAVGITVLLVAVHAIPGRAPMVQAAQHTSMQLPVAFRPATPSLLAVDPVPAPAPLVVPRRLHAFLTTASAGSGKANAAPAAMSATAVETSADTLAATPRWITELPPGRFARPVVGERNLTGEVELQALVAPNGSVKQVTAVRGNRQLAEAGIRAVRQWQYTPFLSEGDAVEAQTRIRMNFFGADAVSIASIGK